LEIVPLPALPIAKTLLHFHWVNFLKLDRRKFRRAAAAAKKLVMIAKNLSPLFGDRVNLAALDAPK
jgi:hypothetical protein